MPKEIIISLLISFVLVFGFVYSLEKPASKSKEHYTKTINCKLMEEETKIHLKPVFDCGNYGRLIGYKFQYRYVKIGDNELKVTFFINTGSYEIIRINGKN